MCQWHSSNLSCRSSCCRLGVERFCWMRRGILNAEYFSIEDEEMFSEITMASLISPAASLSENIYQQIGLCLRLPLRPKNFLRHRRMEREWRGTEALYCSMMTDMDEKKANKKERLAYTIRVIFILSMLWEKITKKFPFSIIIIFNAFVWINCFVRLRPVW